MIIKVNAKKKQGFTFARNFPNIVKDKKKNRGIAMKFIYTRIKDEIRIDKIEDPEAVIYVPEQFEDCPVTELGSYVLAHSAVEEIHLPPYVRKIGAYGFYECEQLKRIYCYSRVLDLGAGLFAGVPAVEYLDITEFPGERSCLKEMLAELRQTLRVQLHQMPAAASEAAEARLIFRNTTRILWRTHQLALFLLRPTAAGIVTATVLQGGCFSTGGTMSFFRMCRSRSRKNW